MTEDAFASQVAKNILEEAKGKDLVKTEDLSSRIEYYVEGDDLATQKLRDKLFETLSRFEERGVISGLGLLKARYEINAPALQVLIQMLDAPAPAPAAPTPAPTPTSADGATAPVPAPEPAKAAAAPASEAAPVKVKLTRWEKVMAQIAAVPVTKLTEAEKAMAIDDAFARMCESVIEANRAITALAEKTDLVDGDVDLLDITRVVPENGRGTGGARITYSGGTGKRGARILVDCPWDPNPTRKGLDKAVRKVENAVFCTIEKMADYVMRHSK